MVDAQGELSNAIIGELMLTWAQTKGIAGVVVDGAVRDAAGIRNLNISVYACRSHPEWPVQEWAWRTQCPISCGGVMVKPGDIVVGDQDGIVVIDPLDAPDILEKARATVTKEEGIMAAIKKSAWDISWMDKALKEKGCEYVD